MKIGLMGIVAILVLMFLGAPKTQGTETFFMPAYWFYSATYVPFKDIVGNRLLYGNHDSMDFVFSRGPLCTEDGVIWHGYHWEWVYRKTAIFGPGPNEIYQRIPVTSLLGEKDGYIVLRKDIFNGGHYLWSPWKKVGKIHWQVNDPITQTLEEFSLTPGDYGSELDPVFHHREDNTWVIRKKLNELVNEFWDGSSKTWVGDILHVQEMEGPSSVIDYWFLKGKGLIRLRITASDFDPPYIWLEAGAY